MVEKTKPKPRGVGPETDSRLLAAGRYGTDDMIKIWGAEKTFEYCLKAQAASIEILYNHGIIPEEHYKELKEKADLDHIDPQRIREIEADTHHDVIAINSAWGEQVSDEATAHINKTRTSADTTETAKALQLKDSLEVYIDSLENLRDITLEKATSWMDVPHMDQTHNYDALPTVAGRPLVFYAEMLQSDIDFLKKCYKDSIVGKWADATGNHHSAKSFNLDGIELQREYCEELGINCMDAPAQIPGREFSTDIVYGVSRSAETMRNISNYIKRGRSDDYGLFKVKKKKRKGSSTMPHKDEKGGNPIKEEQVEAFCNVARGAVTTMLSSCTFDYARDLSGSASDRIIMENLFKFADHSVRRFAGAVDELILIEDRSKERVERTYGIVASQQLMNYLTDPKRTDNTMTRDEAHDTAARLATKAFEEKRNYVDVVLEDKEITSRFDEETLRKIVDPLEFIGESKRIIETVYEKYHGKKAFD